jgi:hypothetical protein
MHGAAGDLSSVKRNCILRFSVESVLGVTTWLIVNATGSAYVHFDDMGVPRLCQALWYKCAVPWDKKSPL